MPDDGLGFHARRAVEKRIEGSSPTTKCLERTHNIAYLLELLDDARITKPDEADDLPNLTPGSRAALGRRSERRGGPKCEGWSSRQGLGRRAAFTELEAKNADATPPPPPPPTKGLARPETLGGEGG